MSNERWIHNPIGVYLMSCYAYEELAAPFLFDHEFDALGQYIAENWATLEHPHKYLIDPACCAYTSGVTKPYHEWPLRILSATHQHTGAPGGNAWRLAKASAQPPREKTILKAIGEAVEDLI